MSLKVDEVGRFAQAAQQAETDQTFTELVEPLRGELTAHCYRMLGSVHDAEDLVQETYLRAWRAYDNFEGRASVRTWMYQIATNACLSALTSKHRRLLPTGLGQPSSVPGPALTERREVTWLEPLPDSVVWGRAPEDPAADVVTRESVRLAFVAALQHLTPPQRAVLILRDVLAWPAAQVADTLGISVAAANSSLQRARAQVAKLDPQRDPAPLDDARLQRLLDDYVEAFERYDIPRIVSLLAADAVWEMPPFTGWYAGAETIGDLISTYCPAKGPGDQRLVRVEANGQPAYALYMRDPDDGVHRAFQIQQLALDGDRVAHVVSYFDLDLFERFGLPRELTPA